MKHSSCLYLHEEEVLIAHVEVAMDQAAIKKGLDAAKKAQKEKGGKNKIR
jgi:hypothetical protein